MSKEILKALKQIFEDWGGDISFLRVFGAIELAAANFGLIWGIIHNVPQAIISCASIIVALFGAKYLQTRVEAQASQKPDEKVG